MKNFTGILLLIALLATATKDTLGQQQATTDTGSVLQLISKGKDIADAEPQAALKLLNDALYKSSQINFSKGTALASARIGRWYFANNSDSSILYAKKALEVLETSVPLAREKADMHLLLAEVYDEQGHTDSSAYYYFLLGDEAESGNINDAELLISIYTKLAIFWGNVYSGANNDPKVIATIRGYVEKVKRYALLIKDPADGISSSYFVQGIFYHYTNFDSARYFYKEYIVSREKLKKLNVPRKVSTLANIADTYLMENRPNDAMPYIKQVKELCSDPAKADYFGFYLAFIGLLEGKALYQQQNYTAAIDVLNSSLEKLKKTGGHLRGDVVEAYKILAASQEAVGNYQQALVNKNIFITLNDSLSKIEKVDMISRLEIRYRIAEKDKELVQQQLTIAREKDKVRRKNLLIAVVSAILLLLAMLLMMWRRRNLHKQKIQQQNIENLQQKIKIERLHATIAGEEKERTRIARELHDGIGGLLTGAKMNFDLFKKNIQPEKITDYQVGIKLLEEAGIELRQAAKNLMPEILLQEGLVKAVEVFCKNVEDRSELRVDFQAMGDKKSADSNFDLSLYRIIQELLHNIVKHAKAKNAIVQVNFQEDGGMSITVEDDGVGMGKTVTSGGSGMGMKNIQERIRESGGTLDIKSEAGNGTSVYIEFESLQQIKS